MMGKHENEMAEMVHAEWCQSNLEDEIERLNALLPRVNYIATYQAKCVDGNTITANITLSGVAKGADPARVIGLVTDMAHEDIARSGMNATSVLVLNLSRVW